MTTKTLDNRKFLNVLLDWHIYDNVDLIYCLSVIHRKKDVLDKKADPIKENKLLDFYFLRNRDNNFEENYNKILQKCMDLCDKTKSRLYLKVAPREVVSFNFSLINYISEKQRYTFDYKRFSKSCFDTCVPYKRKVVLDLDGLTIYDVHRIQYEIYEELKETRHYESSEDVEVIPTFNGFHIVSPGFNPDILSKFRNDPKYKFDVNTWKEDADTLIYGVRELE